MPDSRQAASPTSQPPCLPQRTPGPDAGFLNLPGPINQISIFLVVVVVVACGQRLRLQRATWGPCAWLLDAQLFGITITLRAGHGSYMTIITVWCCCSTDNLACLRKKTSRVADRVVSCVIVNLIPPVWRIDTEGGCKCKCVRVRCAVCVWVKGKII
ncbi:hypothetical protein CGCSCA4_v011211 [Colletotrichum siamense]|uniref:Uncharacterized protein n=1 Tax=Colletotrichum siamense TaxID=690259 RepID=A0A9P5ELK0_COLSI|nr:hypothetical protein CGCSCA4_v011211 [Colletotrichum siamense]KAF4853169.1 hypothetical protein CGCSCA2_v009998 [Colletotrichum siamense]